jgi:hypothetical protein
LSITFQSFKLNVDQVKGAIQASSVLEPPFYDEITAMNAMGNMLYAASRDGCMKKWRVGEREALQVMPRVETVDKNANFCSPLVACSQAPTS